MFWLMIKSDRVYHVRNMDHFVFTVKKFRKMYADLKF